MQNLLELLQNSDSADLQIRDSCSNSLDSLLFSGDQSGTLDQLLTIAFDPQYGDNQLKSALLLKNKFKRNHVSEMEKAFEQGQNVIFGKVVENYQQWLMVTPKKVSDHISILLGSIIKANISRYLVKNEEVEEDIQYQTLNKEVTGILQKVIQGQEQNIQILRHLKIIVENASNSDFPGIYSSNDFVWLVSQISQKNTLKYKIQVVKICLILIDQISQAELRNFASQINSQIFEVLKNIDSQEPDFLKFMKHLTNLMISINNLESDYVGFTASQKIDAQSQFFFSLGFQNNPIFEAYLQDCPVAEEILGNSLGYFKGLLDDPSIWKSDMIGFDFTTETEESKEDLEEYVTSAIFTQDKIFAMLQEITNRYIIFSSFEIEKWNENSLEFFMDQKEQKNETRGNFLREKAKTLIAQLSFRFGPIFEKFCASLISNLDNLKDGDVQTQLKRDAVYQILSIRLCDENNVEIEPFVKLIQADLERENSYLIVKSRSIQLLAKLSSFQALQYDTQAQELLLNGVINVYISQENQSVDLYLQMCCMEYLKNFYNDSNFKINKYAHLLPKVLEICNQMILKYSQVKVGDIEVINEILELYRFIVEKYAGFNQGGANISQLAGFLNVNIWSKFSELKTETEDEEKEKTLILSSVSRIMCHIISKMPLGDLPKETVKEIIQISFRQANDCLIIAQDDYVLFDYSLTYLACLGRVLSKLQLQDPEMLTLPEPHQMSLQSSIKQLMKQSENESEIENIMVVIEELTIVCLLSNEELFLKDVELNEFVESGANSKHVANYLKVIMSMLERQMLEFSKVIATFVTNLLNDQNINLPEVFDEVIAPLTAILIIKDDSLQPFVQQFLEMITQKVPNFLSIALETSNSSQSTSSSCLFLGMCFANPFLKEHIKMSLHGVQDQTQQLAIFDQLKTSQDVINNFIGSEIESRVEVSSVLTQEHLLHLNNDSDEGLFFDCFYDVEGIPTANNIKTPFAKTSKVVKSKHLLDREMNVFKAIKQSFQ